MRRPRLLAQKVSRCRTNPAQNEAVMIDALACACGTSAGRVT